MNPLSELLAGHDRWTGASCIDRWETFDPRGDDEPDREFHTRVRRAQAVCRACPILDQCREFAANARPADRAGVLAGVPYDHRGRPVRTHQETQ
ncbi:MAG: WhiB family transcriptional regulator [Dietzia sp.]|nr:WhiB family transcriptional regulator [Dietzia sp.]